MNNQSYNVKTDASIIFKEAQKYGYSMNTGSLLATRTIQTKNAPVAKGSLGLIPGRRQIMSDHRC